MSEQVIAEALREAVDWDPSIKISVNISPTQLTDGWLAQRIVRLLDRNGFPGRTGWWSKSPKARCSPTSTLPGSIVTSLKNQGVQLALDDFGTGFSSLSHLRSLPFDIIKIDRSFVANIHAKREKARRSSAPSRRSPAALVGAGLRRGHRKRDAPMKRSSRLGCAIGQGWYFGKPMRAEQARELLAEPRTRRTQTLPNAVNG